MSESVESYEAAERFQPEDVDLQSHDSSRCNIGAGPCPGCNAAENA